MTELRPVLTTDLPGRELLRWYWLQNKLANFARSVGISVSGGKQELTARLVALLDGQAPPPARSRAKPPPLLAEPLTAATVIPVGQRCTEQLRRYFTALIGPSFRFDAAMRAFIADHAGQTLGTAVDHWHTSRSQSPPEIGNQFELNRFLRNWRRDHPHGSPAVPVDTPQAVWTTMLTVPCRAGLRSTWSRQLGQMSQAAPTVAVMAAALPCPVLVWFGRPIEPDRVDLGKGPNVTDAPLDVDELPGWLDAWRFWPNGWQGAPGGWYGQVWYRYPTHGYAVCLQFVAWFPATRLRPTTRTALST